MNYSEMTDDALRVEIAKRLGWGVERGSMFPLADNVPNWPVNIAAAWALIDDMQRRGFHARITSPFDPRLDGGKDYFCGFTPHGITGFNGRPDFEAHAPSAARAISIAYLIATEAKENKP